MNNSSNLLDSFLIDLTFIPNLLSCSKRLLIDFSLLTAVTRVNGSSSFKSKPSTFGSDSSGSSKSRTKP